MQYVAQSLKLVKRACKRLRSSGVVVGLDSLSACTACTISPLNLSKTLSRSSPTVQVALAAMIALTKCVKLNIQEPGQLIYEFQ